MAWAMSHKGGHQNLAGTATKGRQEISDEVQHVSWMEMVISKHSPNKKYMESVHETNVLHAKKQPVSKYRYYLVHQQPSVPGERAFLLGSIHWFQPKNDGDWMCIGRSKKRSHHDKETILYPYKLVHRRSCYYSFLSHVKCINANITATKLGDLPGMRFFGFLARFSDRSAPDDLQKK